MNKALNINRIQSQEKSMHLSKIYAFGTTLVILGIQRNNINERHIQIISGIASIPKMCLCLPPSVMAEVYCFPRRLLIFSFGSRNIYHSKGL